MAQGDLVATCGRQYEVNELLAMVTVRHDDGRIGLRTQSIAVGEADLNPYVDCAMPGPIMDVKTWLNDIVRYDACDQPAITLFTCT
jgi:hypothetical protein